MKEEFDRRRAPVLTDEHGRMIGTVAELGLMVVFAAGAAERLDARLAIRAAHPPVAGAKPELRERGGFLDRIDRGEQRRRIHAITWRPWRSGYRSNDFGHVLLLFDRRDCGDSQRPERQPAYPVWLRDKTNIYNRMRCDGSGED